MLASPDDSVVNGADIPAIDLFKQSRKALSPEQISILLTTQRSLADDRLMDNDDTGTQRLATYLATEPANVPSIMWLALGDAYMSAKRVEQATQAWLNAVSVNSHNYFAHDRLGQYYRDSGQFSLAMEHYDLALNAWPDFANGYRHRGILKDLYLGQKESALADYVKLKQLLNQQDAEPEQIREVERWIKEMQRAINEA